MDKPNTRVVLRLRPCDSNEQSVDNVPSLTYKPAGDGGQLLCFSREGMPERYFHFDGVSGPEEGPQQLYDEHVQDLVDHWLSGFNSTVFAYGQVSSGKSATLGTDCNTDVWQQQQQQQEGVLPNAVQHMFEALSDMDDRGTVATIRLGAVEIVNDQVRDLMVGLAQGGIADRPSAGRSVSIREAPAGGILLVGAETCLASTAQEVQQLIEEMNARKAASSTARGAHVVYTFHLEQFPLGSSSASQQLLTADSAELGAAVRLRSASYTERPRVMRSKLHIVDLAASESNRRAATGGGFVRRGQESITANKGLHALGNVLAALAEPVSTRRPPSMSSMAHIPFRESKLTRILADSLAPPARICLIICIAPMLDSVEDTWATLKYAARSRSASISASLRQLAVAEDVAHSPREPASGQRRSGISAAVDAVSKSWHTFTGALQRATGPSRAHRYLLDSGISSLSESSGLSKRTQYGELLRSKFRAMQSPRNRASMDTVRPSALSASSPRLATTSAPLTPRSSSVDASVSRAYQNVPSKVAQAWKPRAAGSAASETRAKPSPSPLISPSPPLSQHRFSSPTRTPGRQHSAGPKALAEVGRQGSNKGAAATSGASFSGSGPSSTTAHTRHHSKTQEAAPKKRAPMQRRHSHLQLDPARMRAVQLEEPSLQRASNPFPLTQAAAKIADELPNPRPGSCSAGPGTPRYSDWRATWKRVLGPHAPALVEGYEQLVEDFASFSESMRRAESITDGSSRIGSFVVAKSTNASPLRGASMGHPRTPFGDTSMLPPATANIASPPRASPPPPAAPRTPAPPPEAESRRQPIPLEDRRQSDSSSGEWRLEPRCDSCDASTYLGPGLTRQVNFLITTGSVVEGEPPQDSLLAAQGRLDDLPEHGQMDGELLGNRRVRPYSFTSGSPGPGQPRTVCRTASCGPPSPRRHPASSVCPVDPDADEAAPATPALAASGKLDTLGLAYSPSTAARSSRARGSAPPGSSDMSDLAAKLQCPTCTAASPRDVHLTIDVSTTSTQQGLASPVLAQATRDTPSHAGGEAGTPASTPLGPRSVRGLGLTGFSGRSASMPNVHSLAAAAGCADSLPTHPSNIIARLVPSASGSWSHIPDTDRPTRPAFGGDKFDRQDSFKARHLESASMDGIAPSPSSAAPPDGLSRGGQTDGLTFRPSMMDAAGPSWPALAAPSPRSPALPLSDKFEKLDRLDRHASSRRGGGGAMRPSDDDMRIEVQEHTAAMLRASNSFNQIPCAAAVPRASLNSLASSPDAARCLTAASGGEGSQGRVSLKIRTREGGLVRVPLTNTDSESAAANDVVEKLAMDDDRDLRQSFEGDYVSVAEAAARWRAIVSSSSQGSSSGGGGSTAGASSTRSSGIVASIAKLFSRT